MAKDRDESWSSSLVTASSFLGLVVSVLFGGIALLSGGQVDPEYFALGGVCGASFLAHLRLA